MSCEVVRVKRSRGGKGVRWEGEGKRGFGGKDERVNSLNFVSCELIFPLFSQTPEASLPPWRTSAARSSQAVPATHPGQQASAPSASLAPSPSQDK